nr:hypothetical protein [Tanacetum cinerariifolium]
MEELYVAIPPRKNNRMMLESIQSGPLVYPTIKENGHVRNKKYAKVIKKRSFKMTVMFKHSTLFFKTDDLDAYDSDCNDISSAKTVLLANLLSYNCMSSLSCANKQEIESLKQTLSKQVKEKESLLQTLTVFKKESKEKEDKYMDKEVNFKKKIKELDNIVYKVGQSMQIVHMLMKPHVFYDDTHKQALGYQNPFYLKKAQRIRPTLYDGSVISKKLDVIYVVIEAETLILEEDSR